MLQNVLKERIEFVGRKKIGFLNFSFGKSIYRDLPNLLSSDYEVVFISSMEEVGALERGLKTLSLLITFSEYTPPYVEVIARARRAGVETLILMDGISDWRNSFERPFGKDDLSYAPPESPFQLPSLCTYIACIGFNQFTFLSKFGNSEKVILTGSPKLDDFYTESRAYALSIDKAGTQPSGKKILICTARTPAFNKHQMEKLMSFLEAGKSALKDSGYQLNWRVSFDIAEQLGVSNSTQSLIDDLANTDVVLTSPSTLGIESMMLEKPTAILNPFNSPLFLQSPWVLNSVDDFDLLDEMVDPPMHKMLYQELMLELNYNTGYNSRENLLIAINNIVDGRFIENGRVKISTRNHDFSITDIFEDRINTSKLKENNRLGIVENLLKRIDDLKNKGGPFEE